MSDFRVRLGQGPTGSADWVLKRANRHGLVAGATGTGKTVTLQKMAEALALNGVPVFAVDVKGDLCGLAAAKDPAQSVAPALLVDVLGQSGHPVRTTLAEFGPVLLSRLLDLTDVQASVLDLLFKVMDDQGLLLLDLKDLRAALNHLSENASEISKQYGLVANSSIAAVQRALIGLENEGGDVFFGEPAFELDDLMLVNGAGLGHVTLLAADKLILRPRLYAAFLLWLLSELFETLPEVGDLPKPKLILFFDEAHLLFDNAPPTLLQKIEQVVRLIRSKGVGVYFVTQNPLDIPESILGQLGNRVQHALRAYTPKDQKAVRAAAETFRPNPAFDANEVISSLGVGEALFSFLDEKGVPGMVERVKIDLPVSRLGPLSALERQGLMAMSPLRGKYDQTVDRESAQEILNKKVAAQAAPVASAPATTATGGADGYRSPWGQIPDAGGDAPPAKSRSSVEKRGDSVGEAFAKNVARSVGSAVGREIVRGVLGGLFGSSRRRR